MVFCYNFLIRNKIYTYQIYIQNKIFYQKYYIGMIFTGNLTIITMALEYFNNSLYILKVICGFLVKFGFTQKCAENGHFQKVDIISYSAK